MYFPKPVYPIVMVVALLAAGVEQTKAVSFDLPSTSRRCVFDQLKKDQLGTGEYSVSNKEGAEVDVDIMVSGPRGEEVFSKTKTSSGKYGFTADSTGDYKTCFMNNDMVQHRITVILRSGIEAKDLSEVVQRDHLKPLAAEILRIEETLKSIREDLLVLKQREGEMRDTNEMINSRVTVFSLFSIFVVSSLGVWQVLHLKSYFLEKKLI